MKRSKAGSIIIFVVYIVAMVSMQKGLFIAFACAMTGLMLFSIIVRRNIMFKPYFISKYNVFSSKIRHQKDIDLPKDILFDKMKDVLSEAGFKVQYANKETGTLFATSGISFYSWGENIYVDMVERNGATKVDFCSACFFGAVSWGRNEKNYEHLLETFENSLII